MRKRFYRNYYFLLSVLSSLAADGEYAVAKIPAALLKNANAVIRLEEISFEIINTGKAILTKQYVITILNENGDDWAEFYEYYDKLPENRIIRRYFI